jgi:hypothetical protein
MPVSSRNQRSTSTACSRQEAARSDAGAPAAPLGDEQLDQLRGGVGGYVERSKVGDYVGSSRS